jgi:uncharacterized protein (TIGR02996 family)
MPRGWADLAARLHALAERGADPRIATYLHGLITAPPTRRGTFWRELFDAIANVGDPRSLDQLAAFAPRIRDLVGGSRESAVKNRLAEATTRLRARKTVPLGAADKKSLAKLAAKVSELGRAARAGAADGDALLAAVRADPHDERALAVYADWLQERGDPRGELVALQLANREPARQRALIAKHGKSWLGAVGTVTTQKYTRFERGLPVAVTVNPRNEPTLAATIKAPEWATIEEMSFTGMFADSLVCADLVCSPTMRALRDLRGIGLAPMKRIARTKAKHAITHVTMRSHIIASELARAPGLPALERVTTSGCADVSEILAVLAIALPYELGFTDGETRYVVSRARDALRIELLDLAKPGISLRDLATIVGALPKLRSVAVAVPDPEAAGVDKILARTVGAIRRDPRCEVVRL